MSNDGRVATGCRDGGSVSVLMVAAAGIVVLIVAAVGDLGALALARARAQTAADAAALAAAAETVIAGGRDPPAQAVRLAALNGARVSACECRVGVPTVIVEVSLPARLLLLGGTCEVRARARADALPAESWRNAPGG